MVFRLRPGRQAGSAHCLQGLHQPAITAPAAAVLRLVRTVEMARLMEGTSSSSSSSSVMGGTRMKTTSVCRHMNVKMKTDEDHMQRSPHNCVYVVVRMLF